MRFSVCLCLALYALPALAHPAPDVPVRAWFSNDGEAVIQIEVDPRCFEEDPLNTPYLIKRQLDEMSQAQQQHLKSRAAAFVPATVQFSFEPTALTPDFEYTFATHGGKSLGKELDDPVMVMAEWKFELPEGTTGYKIEALPAGKFSVLFLNVVDGVTQKKNVLFPGEISYRVGF